jgi:hypothetical protein
MKTRGYVNAIAKRVKLIFSYKRRSQDRGDLRLETVQASLSAIQKMVCL